MLASKKQILQAYIDCQVDSTDLKTYRVAVETRSLDILGKPLSVAGWAKLMSEASPGGYNNFDAEKVGLYLARFQGKVKIHPAREHSVAAYVVGPRHYLEEIQQLREKLQADEADFIATPIGVEDRGGCTLRLWWD